MVGGMSLPCRSELSHIPSFLPINNLAFRGVSLKDHIATVNGYLNQYMLSNEKDRLGMSVKFFSYITAVCWRKLHRRMNHWAAVQLISDLASLESLDGQRDWLPLPPGGVPNARSDSRLAAEVIALRPVLHIVMSNYPVEHPTEVPKLEKLMSECRKLSSTLKPTLYTPDTRFDFHRLLVTLLVGYTKSLQVLYSENQQRGDMQQVGEFVNLYARPLLAILNSNAMKSHLEVLDFNDFLHPPSTSRLENSISYSTKHGFASVPLIK